MKIYDISMTIHHDMAVYKNKPEKKPVIENRANYETANHYESSIYMDLHTGTHIDAPLHMVKDGKKMDMYKIEDYVTPVKVLDFSDIEEKITKADLEKHDIQKGDFILLKTRNSNRDDFDFEFVYLEKTGAQYLQEIGIKGVGIDSLGIERAQSDHMTHKVLLGNDIMIVEGLRLKDIEPKQYMMVILPIKLLEAEAAPARAILIEHGHLNQ